MVGSVVLSYILAYLHNHYCHGNATIHSLCIVVGVGVAVNIQVFHIAMEMQQWVPFALLSSHRIFCIAVNKYEILCVCVCILSLVIQLTYRTFCVLYCIVIDLSGSSIFFCTFHHKWHNFQKKIY